MYHLCCHKARIYDLYRHEARVYDLCHHTVNVYHLSCHKASVLSQVVYCHKDRVYVSLMLSQGQDVWLMLPQGQCVCCQ